MFLSRQAGASSEQRLARLEKAAQAQAFVILIAVVVIILNTCIVAAIWEEKGKPDYDHIAVAMTMFQTLFGIAALYGFWALRGLTKETAEEAAREVASSAAQQKAEEVARQAAAGIAATSAAETATRIAEEEVRRIVPSLVLRGVNQAVETFRNEGTISETQVDSLVAAFGGKEVGDGQ